MRTNQQSKSEPLHCIHCTAFLGFWQREAPHWPDPHRRCCWSYLADLATANDIVREAAEPSDEPMTHAKSGRRRGRAPLCQYPLDSPLQI